MGICKDRVGNSAIAQLTHDICHIDRLPAVRDLRCDSPRQPRKHTHSMQDPSVLIPFALEAPIYQQQMEISIES